MKVYLLWHTNPETDDEKLLGIYSSQGIGESRIQDKYRHLPGFSRFPTGFELAEYELDEDCWTEGFVTEALTDPLA